MNQQQKNWEKARKKESRERARAYVFLFVIDVVIGSLCIGIYWMQMGRPVSMMNYFMHMAVIVLMWLASTPVHWMVHEIGHLVCGLITGYRFCSFRIGSLMLVRTGGRLKLKRYFVSQNFMQCIMGPPDQGDGEMPYVVYNMGGCLGQLLFVLMEILVSLFIPEYPMAVTALQITAVLGICIILSRAVPVKALYEDGYNTMRMSMNSAERRAFWLQMKIREQLLEGVRLKDMPDEWFVLPGDEDLDGLMCGSVAVFICNRLMDNCRMQEAAALMEKLQDMKTGIPWFQQMLFLEDRLYCELVGENDILKVVRMWSFSLEAFEKKLKRYPVVIRTRYAFHTLYKLYEIEEVECPLNLPNATFEPSVYTVENGLLRAKKSREQFEKYARSYPYPGEIERERMLLEYAKMQKEKKVI